MPLNIEKDIIGILTLLPNLLKGEGRVINPDIVLTRAELEYYVKCAVRMKCIISDFKVNFCNYMKKLAHVEEVISDSRFVFTVNDEYKLSFTVYDLYNLTERTNNFSIQGLYFEGYFVTYTYDFGINKESRLHRSGKTHVTYAGAGQEIKDKIKEYTVKIYPEEMI